MNDPLKYTCLFGGGAIRGLAYIGAMRAMEELDIKFDIIGGSSVGAAIATLLACGYKSYELENLFMKVNFELFKDIHFGFGKIFALSKGEHYVDWLNELISQKAENPSSKKLTFKELNKNLVIITTNLKNFSSQEFSKDTTPDFEVAKAIRISSSMPGLMPPYDYNGASLVDGDLQKASPMWKLSDTLRNTKSRVLEFRLEGECGNPDNNPISFINTIYSCVTDVATEFVTEIYGQNDKYDCIKINTGGIFFADLNLDKESRRKVIDNGYKVTMNYFKEVLPKKKEKLQKIYEQMSEYLKNSYKGLKSGNVEEVQWWIGDLFILMCENKEIIDPEIYDLILHFKNSVMTSVKNFLIIYTKFNNKKNLDTELKHLIQKLDEKAAEMKLYIQHIK